MEHNLEYETAKKGRCNPRVNEPVSVTLVGITASFYVFFQYTGTYESLLVVFLSAASTIFFLYYITDEEHFIAVRLDFSVVSVAIVFPLTFLMGQTFNRREQALTSLAEAKALIMSISMSFFSWEFSSSVTGKFGGRQYLPEKFDDAALANGVQLLQELKLYLLQPMVTRARHLVFFKKSLTKGKTLESTQFCKMTERIHWSYYLVEIMKERGLSPTECSRINRYHMQLATCLENLRNFKWYRTPQATRSFGTVYIVVLPFVYGPYYAWVAGKEVTTTTNVETGAVTSVSHTSATNAAFAIFLSMLTSIVLLGLLNVQRRMEDPFTALGIDSIRVEEDLDLTERNLRVQHKLAKIHLRKRAADKEDVTFLTNL